MKMAMPRSKWFLPAFCVAMGVVLLVAFWIGDDVRQGLYFLAWLSGFGLVILLAGPKRNHSRLAWRRPGRALSNDRHQRDGFCGDGRWSCALIGAWVVELARGHDGSPYGELMAVGGVAYLLGDRVHALAGLSRLSNVGSSSRSRGGLTSRHVHCSGSLSSRKRRNLEPWRKRLPCTLS